MFNIGKTTCPPLWGKFTHFFDQVSPPFNNMSGLYMPFYMKNIKLFGWDKCIKKVFKKYFMIKITHKVSVMHLICMITTPFSTKKQESLILSVAFNSKDFRSLDSPSNSPKRFIIWATGLFLLLKKRFSSCK